MSNIEKIQKSYPSFDAYIQAEFVEKIYAFKANQANLNEEELQHLIYLQNNYLSIQNSLNSYSPSDSIKQQTNKQKTTLNVYIIMENWCGSSAGNVPYIVKLLSENPLIKITIVLRDTNIEFMDEYLTNGKRSIPKVIGFDDDGNEKFVWGSASKMQAEFAATVQARNIDFQDFVKEIQAWFVENNAKAIESDFLEIFEKL
jgi:hypothetical protein